MMRIKQRMSTIKLSVIVPSYNESVEVKRAAIHAIDEYLSKQSYSYEVLIVDDQSTNNTLEMVEAEIKDRKGFRLIKNSHGGKAIAVMTGLLASRGEIALFTDMDQATPITELGQVLPKFGQGYNVVIGSRHGRKGAPLIRKLASLVFSLLRNLILGLPFSDTQCGFKALDRKAITVVIADMLKSWQDTRAGGAAVNVGFDVEMLFIARKRGLKIASVDVNWHHVGNEKQVQLIKDSLEAVRDIVKLRFNSLTGRI